MINNVIEKLVSLGVIHESDIEFVERTDIEDVLPPIQCRKLIQGFQQYIKNKKEPVEEVDHSTQHSPTIPSETLAPTCLIFGDSTPVNQNVHITVAPFDWAENFSINWNEFPKEITDACLTKTRPENKYTSEMIRMIVAQILKIDVTPGRRNLRVIAKKIVNSFPASFQDTCGDSVIAGGAVTIMKKLEDCLDNRSRRSALMVKFAAPEDEMPRKKIRKTARDSLGCINWQPNDLPLGEDKASQQKLKLLLIAEFEKDNPNNDFIKSAMAKTYATQRFFINNKKSVEQIRAEWPFLLDEKCNLSHFEILVGKNILILFKENLPNKCQKIFQFMKTQVSKKRVSNCITNIIQAKEAMKNSMSEILGAFLLLLSYFEEEERFFLQIFKVREKLLSNKGFIFN